jgi:Transposase DDE domain group 1
VTEALARLAVPRATIDVDGSVIRTGATVGWAFRGFNPHHRKDPSYYPLLAHVARTDHILRLKNRPGNVHDSKQAVPFLREVIDDLRSQLGRRVALEFRMDAAFFQRGILQLLAARDCGYAIKVGYWSWLPLKAIAAAGRRWESVAPGVTGHETGSAAPRRPRPPLSVPAAPRYRASGARGQAKGHGERAGGETWLGFPFPAFYRWLDGKAECPRRCGWRGSPLFDSD